MPVRSPQFVRVPVYIRGVLRTTRPTSFGSGSAGLGTDAPHPEVHGEGRGEGKGNVQQPAVSWWRNGTATPQIVRFELTAGLSFTSLGS